MATPDRLNKVKYHGRVADAPAETVSRGDEWSDGRNFSFEFFGKYGQLFDKSVKPGDRISSLSAWMSGDFPVPGNLYVRTSNIAREDGGTGVMSVKAVMCPNGKTKPYNETWEVAMEEVQHKLIQHPIFHESESDAKVRDIIFKWENTDEIYRTKAKGDDWEFRYANGESNPDGTPVTVRIDNEKAIAYCKAVNAGIETYNEYLPVITHVSYYLELPGVDYNLDTHMITGGTISEFTGPDKIGNFDTPKMLVKGYDDNTGRWFKSCDKFTSNSDGTWVRTEQWTFTRDKTHSWIYTGKLED